MTHRKISLQILVVCPLILAMVHQSGGAEAQVFVLQGELGPPGESKLECSAGNCTLSNNLNVTGNINTSGNSSASSAGFSGAGTFEQINADNIIVDTPSDCPAGYEQNIDEFAEYPEIVLCQRTMDSGKVDQLVKVGDFWIDRFENSVWENPDCTNDISDDQPYGTISNQYPWYMPWTGDWKHLYGVKFHTCSLSDVDPSFSGQWFNLQMMCTLSGKELCTNAQWQAAAFGTYDPGKWPDTEIECADTQSGNTMPPAGKCNNCSYGIRKTGHAGGNPGGEDSCISNWGAEDMVGNLWEVVADWFVVGDVHEWDDPPTQETDWFENESTWHWTTNYLIAGWEEVDVFPHDSTWNIPGYAHHPDSLSFVPPHSPLKQGLPAAAARGGDIEVGEGGGVFAASMTLSPGAVHSYFGSRCCINE